jgi:hypothetical protein
MQGKVAATQESVLDQDKHREHTPTPPRADVGPLQGGCHANDEATHVAAPSRFPLPVAALYQLQVSLLPICDTQLKRGVRSK